MSPVRHVAAKDLRILRWPLLAWFVIVVARVVAASVRGEVTLIGEGPRVALDIVDGFLSFADLALFAVMVSWLVHDDPVVGLDRFWMTRPIGASTLLGAKLGSTAVWLILAPIVVQFASVVVLLHSPAQAAATLTTALIAQSLWALIVLAFAAVTPSLGRMLLVAAGAAGVLAASLSVFVGVMSALVERNSYRDTEISDDSTALVVVGLLLVIALAVVVEQYRTRRTWRAAAVAVGGVTLTVVVAQLWPWSFARPAEPSLPPWAADQATVVARLDAAQKPAVQDVGRIGSTSIGQKQVKLPIRLSGMPPQYTVQAVAVRGQLLLQDGTRLDSAQTTFVGWNAKQRLQSATSMRVLLRPGMDVAAEEPPDALYMRWPIALIVSAEDYQRHGSTPGRLTVDLRALVHRMSLVGTMPLREGASLTTGSLRFELRRVVIRGNTCAILMRQTRTPGGQSGVPVQHQFVLRNGLRGEILAGDVQPVDSRNYTSVMRAVLDLAPEATRPLPFSDLVGWFPSQGMMTANVIDESWLADADIAVLEDVYAGSLARSLTIDDFRMKP